MHRTTLINIISPGKNLGTGVRQMMEMPRYVHQIRLSCCTFPGHILIIFKTWILAVSFPWYWYWYWYWSLLLILILILILVLILVLIIAIDRLVRRAQVQTPADQRKRPDQVGKLVFFSLSQSNFIDNKKTFLIVNKLFVGKKIIFLLLNRRCSHEANQN